MQMVVMLMAIVLSSAQYMDNQTRIIRNLTDFLIHKDSRFNEPFLKNSETFDTRVVLHVSIRNLIDFDVSRGTLTLFATFQWYWTDRSLSWDKGDFNVDLIRLPINKIWFPLVYIENSASGTDALSVAESAEVHYVGHVDYHTPQVLHLLCNPDVSKFPYDVHICAINVAPILNSGGFRMDSPADGLDLSHCWMNSAWNVTAVNVTNREQQFVDFYIRLERHAFFLMLNLIAPILILGVLNLFVFVLPQESGERMSFSITILLSFVVFISFAHQELPDNNISSCAFNVFLLIQLVESALITLAVTLLSWIHHKPDHHKIPNILIRVMFCPRKKIQPKDHQKLEDTGIPVRKITWVYIASTLNIVCLIFFAIVSVVEKVSLLIIIHS